MKPISALIQPASNKYAPNKIFILLCWMQGTIEQALSAEIVFYYASGLQIFQENHIWEEMIS